VGALIDLLKGIPLSAVLKERVEALEAKYAALETELSLKEGDLRKTQSQNEKLQAEVVKLTEEINRLTQRETLDEAEVKILAYLAKSGGSAHHGDITRAVELHTIVVKKSIGTLRQRGLITPTYLRRTQMITGYKLTQSGLEYAIDNRLIADT
jgi:predicted transcriptional regulator